MIKFRYPLVSNNQRSRDCGTNGHFDWYANGGIEEARDVKFTTKIIAARLHQIGIGSGESKGLHSVLGGDLQG